MRTFIVTLLLGSSLSLAQPSAPSAEIEQMWLDPAARGSLFVGNGLTLPQARYRVGLSAFYTQGNLKSFDGQAGRVLLSDRLGAQVFVALGILDWLELSSHVSVFALQQGVAGLALSQAGMGNPWLTVKANLLGVTAPVSLAVAMGMGIPVGTDVAQGNGGFSFGPRVQLGRVFSEFQLSGEVGLLLRPLTNYSPVSGVSTDLVGNQVWASLAVAGVNAAGPRGEASLRAFAPLTGAGRAGLEALFGARWPAGPVEFFVAAGPGFWGEPSTPSLRIYAGAAFANETSTQPPCTEGRAYAIERCPLLDRDGDGIPNGVDRAPLAPEDKDGFEDADGVPDPDNDRDGALDESDECPLTFGPAENRGCPETDKDQDGVVDRLDACIEQPEDRDDFDDSDGCPETDNDQDGIADELDACPRVAGIAQEHGCAPKDSDGDGVADHEDNCASEAGAKENAGCPPQKKQLVRIAAKRLEILEKVFFNSSSSTIQGRSFALLNNVAQVLLDHPEVRAVTIEGHTDNQGDATRNTQLSEKRAEAVREYLIQKGIEASRLKAQGFGSAKPVASNDTPGGREANRRVEFTFPSP